MSDHKENSPPTFTSIKDRLLHWKNTLNAPKENPVLQKPVVVTKLTELSHVSPQAGGEKEALGFARSDTARYSLRHTCKERPRKAVKIPSAFGSPKTNLPVSQGDTPVTSLAEEYYKKNYRHILNIVEEDVSQDDAPLPSEELQRPKTDDLIASTNGDGVTHVEIPVASLAEKYYKKDDSRISSIIEEDVAHDDVRLPSEELQHSKTDDLIASTNGDGVPHVEIPVAPFAENKKDDSRIPSIVEEDAAHDDTPLPLEELKCSTTDVLIASANGEDVSHDDIPVTALADELQHSKIDDRHIPSIVEEDVSRGNTHAPSVLEHKPSKKRRQQHKRWNKNKDK